MNKRYGVLFLLGLLLLSCVEQIDFPLDRQEEKLIVSGQISNLHEEKYIYLSKTTSADRQPLPSGQYLVLNDLPRPVSNAGVFLVSSSNAVFQLREVSPGKYELGRSVPIEEDQSYFVEIQVDGKTYRSSPEEMPSEVGTDELAYEFTLGELNDAPEVPVISIFSDVKLPDTSEPYFLRWDVEEAYFWQLTFFPNPFNSAPPPCYVFGFPQPERFALLNGESVRAGSEGSRQLLAQRRVDQSFLSRHYFTVRQVSLSKRAFDYWRNVRDLINNTGSVFDTPPAPVRGNVINVGNPDEVVLGYVEIARVAQKRIYTTQADVPFVLEEVCRYLPGKPAIEYPRSCRTCDAFPNSSNQVPEWWFDL